MGSIRTVVSLPQGFGCFWPGCQSGCGICFHSTASLIPLPFKNFVWLAGTLPAGPVMVLSGAISDLGLGSEAEGGRARGSRGAIGFAVRLPVKSETVRKPRDCVSAVKIFVDMCGCVKTSVDVINSPTSRCWDKRSLCARKITTTDQGTQTMTDFKRIVKYLLRMLMSRKEAKLPSKLCGSCADDVYIISHHRS